MVAFWMIALPIILAVIGSITTNEDLKYVIKGTLILYAAILVGWLVLSSLFSSFSSGTDSTYDGQYDRGK